MIKRLVGIIFLTAILAGSVHAQEIVQTTAQCRANYAAWNVSDILEWGKLPASEVEYRLWVLISCSAHHDMDKEERLDFYHLWMRCDIELLSRYRSFVERNHLEEQFRKEDRAGKR